MVLSTWILRSNAVPQSRPSLEKGPDYSKEPFVIEDISAKATFENDGTSTLESAMRVRIQSQAGVQQFGLLHFNYPSANESVEIIYVRVRKPDGRVVTTTPESIQDMPADITRLAPFYSDLREKQAAVKGLDVGDVLESQSRMHTNAPLIPGQFWFNYNFFRNGICLREALQISIPRDRYIKVQSAEVQPTIGEQGAYKTYSWKTSNLKRKPQDEKSNPQGQLEVPPPSVQLTTFRSWEEIGQWYRGLEDPRAVPTPEIRTKAEQLTRGATTEMEKLHLLYNYVATRFRYIGIAFGIGRYQPHAAVDVLSNEYGDCKDKHTLLAALLAAVGERAYPVLINSNRKIDPEVPSPSQFDHVITAVPEGKDYLWLDTTTEVAPFGLLAANLRNKDALVIPDNGAARLIKTPADPPFKSSQLFKIEGSLSNTGTLEAKVKASVRGDLELLLRAVFRQIPQPQWNDLMQKVVYTWGFSGTVSDVTASAPEATEEPFEINYDYTRKDYSDWANKRITPPFPAVSLPELQDDLDKSAKPIELGSPGEILFEAKVELPHGLTPFLPTPVDIKQDFAAYHSSNSVTDGVLHAERRLVIKQREIQAVQRDEYREFRKAVINDENYFIVLGGGTSGLAASERSPDAEKLYLEGRQALQQGNLRTAIDSFKRAVGLDPENARAWAALGAAHLAVHEVDQGLDELRKAIKVDPNQTYSYKVMAFGLMALGRAQEAMDTWRQLEKIDPHDRDAPANIGSILLTQKRFSEAVPELEVAVERNPDSSHLLLQLGQAYIHSGNEDKAILALQQAVKLDSTPVMLNDVAYEMADANRRLDDALRYAEKAVQDQGQQTAKILLDKLGSSDLQRIQALEAYWDTLGWVHFRLGHLDEAEKYLNAAWTLSQSAVEGDHLGQVYEKQGKKHAAAQAYAWALAAGHAPPETRKRLVALLGSSVRADESVDLARGELGHLRTVKLGRLTTKRATAEFFLLFEPGPKVADVKFISGSEELRAAANALASAKYDVPFPDNSPVKLLRRGILACEPEAPGCDFVLLTPDSVRSVD